MYVVLGLIVKLINRDIKMIRWVLLLWISRGWNFRVFKLLIMIIF